MWRSENGAWRNPWSQEIRTGKGNYRCDFVDIIIKLPLFQLSLRCLINRPRKTDTKYTNSGFVCWFYSRPRPDNFFPVCHSYQYCFNTLCTQGWCDEIELFVFSCFSLGFEASSSWDKSISKYEKILLLWHQKGLTVELKRRWQMLQEMMGFFFGGHIPNVWFITAFCTGSSYTHTHPHMDTQADRHTGQSGFKLFLIIVV